MLVIQFYPHIALCILKCTWAHTLSCLCIFFFASIGHAEVMWFTVSSNSWHSLHFRSVSVCSIFVAQYFVCNVCSCAATVSLSVSACGSSLDSHRIVSSSLTYWLSVLLIYWPCITLLPHFFFKNFPNVSFVCCMPLSLSLFFFFFFFFFFFLVFFFWHCFHLMGLIILPPLLMF